MGFHEPRGWVDRVPAMLSGPGVHQIRLRSGGNGTDARVGCACGARCGEVPYGGDVWGLWRAHRNSLRQE